jgi:hypothetical protein
MPDIGQIIIICINSWKYVPSDVDMSFEYMDEFDYLYINVTMPIDTRFTFS